MDDFDFENRIVSTELGSQDENETDLRPYSLDEYVGQEKVKEILKISLDAAKMRGDYLDHVLLYGPPGLGKTTLAGIIAAEMGVNFRVTSGPAIEKQGDLAALLTNLGEGDVLFIDEIHRLSRTIEEILYPAMDDFVLDIIIGKGPAARSIRVPLSRFTLIGATTRSGQLSQPLRDRFGHHMKLELYTPEELSRIVRRSAGILSIPITKDGALEIASRSRGTPRIANRLLKRVRDFAQVKGDGTITAESANAALSMLEIDELGLDNFDRKTLRTIIDFYDGGPVGLDTLAATIGEEAVTIEDVCEPYLMQIGFLSRTPRGRCATRLAYEHLGIAYQPGGSPKGEGLRWLAALGHEIEAPVPSLFTFSISDVKLHALQGLVVENAAAFIPGTKYRAEGPLLITHWGMSGPAILKLSSYTARYLADNQYYAPLSINWLQQREEDIQRAFHDMSVREAQKLLTTCNPFGLQQRLWSYLLEKALEQRAALRWCELNKKDVNRLVNILMNDTYQIAGRAAFKDEFVTCGGVSLKAINPSTLESRHVAHLYFAGEVLDIDGITGGFNFQAAWTTAYTIAQSIAKNQ